MSTNISGEKREALLSKIAQIKTFIEKNAEDKNATQLLGYLGDLSREVNGKKYGLVFEEHRENIDELLDENAPVFTEEKKLFVDNGGELNFLLEGDNLASLKLLEKTHRGKIDVIYIDPPYNTGNKDFIYDDDFVDSNDQFRHSKWLSFMEKRLQIARELLSEKGVIFISIDDNEQASLKMLCDEIFGENNFVAKFDWRKKTGANDAKDIAIVTESIILFAKNKIACIENGIWNRDTESIDNERYKFEDEFVKERGKFYYDTLDRGGLQYSDSMNYGIEMPDGKLLFPNGRSCFENDGWIWKWGKEKVQWAIDNKFVEFTKSSKNSHTAYTIKYKVYEKVDNEGKPRDKRGRAFMNLITSPINQQGNGEIKDLFGNNPFSNPKPIGLITYLLNTTNLNSATVLDFFAGSGTTGHAVLKLNAEDGGHRKFILCTNNENNICRDITYQRLKTAITGKRKDKSKYSDGLPGSLKYFKTDFIPISEKMYYEYADELLLHVRELVELENAVNFDKDASVAIVLDDDEMEVFIKRIVGSCPTMTVDSPIKTLYLGHDVLLSSKQERILKVHNISVNVIPDYYYRELAL